MHPAVMDQLPALSLALAPACPAFPTLSIPCAEFYSTGCLPATTLRAPRRRGEYDDSFGPGDYGWGTDIVTTTLTTDVTEYYHPEPTTVWTTWGEPITSTPTHGVVWVTVYEGSETTVTLNPPEVITYTFYPTTTILDTSTVVEEQTAFATSTLLTTETREVSSTVVVTGSPTLTLASSETLPTTPPPWLTLTTTESTETGDDATSTRTSTSSSAGATATSNARSVCQPGDEDQEEQGLFSLTDEQRLTLFVAGIYSIGITLMWNLWGIRWLFYSLKSFTAFIHESGHVVGLLVSSQPLYRFTIDPNVGGATYTTPGRRLKAPAMYLGQVFSIAFGGAMVFTGFGTLASKYASFVVMALWLPVIGLQRNLLSMLNCAVPLGLLVHRPCTRLALLHPVHWHPQLVLHNMGHDGRLFPPQAERVLRRHARVEHSQTRRGLVHCVAGGLARRPFWLYPWRDCTVPRDRVRHVLRGTGIRSNVAEGAGSRNTGGEGKYPSTMPFQPNQDDQKAINTIRTLALDTVNKANSGHPGAPMGMAPAAHVLFSRFFQCNPSNPSWVNRDRFVLSNGHACALQYVLLHLLGYKVSIDDLKQFRQLDSITPGHPEVGVTPGIEVTTGPLGQGFANAVGLAIAQAHLGATFNKDGYPLFDNYTYMFTGDGCLMEGVSSEAASLAGHLKLGNLIAIYDDNQISIDGSTSIAFTEDVAKRFESYDWQVLHVERGDDDLKAIYEAIEAGRAEKTKPTIICLKTTIGFGSRDAGTHGVHGNPLKADDTVEIKKQFGFDPEQFFVVPDETKKIYGDIAARGAEAEKKWQATFDEYKGKYADEAADISRRLEGKLPDGWEKALPEFKPSDDAVASRKLSEVLLAKLSTVVPELVSGSADLTPSNLTRWKNAVDFQPKENGLGDYSGRYIRYGVREHGMGAIANGIAAYGPNLMIPAIGTFLNFVSYAAGAVRLAALSHLRVIWVATHDSIGLGEDGPTHQPIETVAHFRALPNCNVWRPADGNETSAAYYVALTSTHTPSILALTRQNLPQLAGSSIQNANKGGYVLHEVEGQADVTIVATGSEVAIAVEAAELLGKQGVKARVASLPCWEVFRAQSQDYKLSVLPDGAPIISVEAYTTMGWSEWSHAHVGIDTFGASAPAKAVYKKFGITGEDVAARSQKAIAHFKKLGHPVYSPVSHSFAI